MFFRAPNKNYSGAAILLREDSLPLETIVWVATCFLIGAAMIAYSFYQRSLLIASNDWQQTVGTIRASRLVEEKSDDGTQYSLAVTYEYVVNGRRYTGKRIEFGKRSYVRKRHAEAKRNDYAVGSSVPVFFDPNEPGEAVLVRRTPYFLLYLIIGFVLLFLAAEIAASKPGS